MKRNFPRAHQIPGPVKTHSYLLEDKENVNHKTELKPFGNPKSATNVKNSNSPTNSKIKKTSNTTTFLVPVKGLSVFSHKKRVCWRQEQTANANNVKGEIFSASCFIFRLSPHFLTLALILGGGNPPGRFSTQGSKNLKRNVEAEGKGKNPVSRKYRFPRGA